MSQHLNYSDSIPADQLRDIHTFHKITDGMISLEEGLVLYKLASLVPVSYTHLTLPTIYSV